MRCQRILLALAAGLLSCGTAAAAHIPWSYSVAVQPGTLISGRWHYEDMPGGMSAVILSNMDYHAELQGLAGSASGPGDVSAFNVRLNAIVNPSGFGDFDPTIHQFTVDFHVTDGGSGASELLQFHGALSGFAELDGGTLAVSFSAPESKSTTLGGNTYTVTLLPGTSAFSLAETGAGDLAGEWQGVMARVDIRSAAAPEPGTLALAGFAAVFLGLLAWRRKACS